MLIVKGWWGFGDRLQSLKMCVHYAQVTKRKIYVDWSDLIWSHGSEDFYTYFSLDMPTFKISDIPASATVYPSFWKGKLDQPLDNVIVHNPEINIGKLDNYNISEDVIVFSSIGFRYVYNDSDFFTNVFKVVEPTVIAKVKDRINRYKLHNKIGIHLRGTDRANTVDRNHRMAGMNIRMMTLGLMNGQEFIAVSDDPEYIKFWKTRYSEHPMLTEVGNLGGREGVHNMLPGALPISKHALNVDLLVDFFTLSACKSVISTSTDSRFAQESQKLKRMFA